MVRAGYVERPVRQFSHWIEELNVGLEFARLRVAETAPLDKSFHVLDTSLRIKNTFIDISERAAAVGRSRSTSLPPRIKLNETKDNSDSCAEDEDHHTASRKLQNQVTGIEASSFNVVDVSANPKCTASEEKIMRDSEWEARLHARNMNTVGGNSPVWKQQDCTMSRNSAAMCKGQANQARWWNDVDDACPVSGFPIKLLPCPPFKLHLQGENARLVDGSTLLLTILAKWDFMVLGRHLSSNQIRELDDHVKRCKLGPYRLAKAIGLLTQGTRESQEEFELMRAKARKKLRELWHIQRVRRKREYDMARVKIGSSKA
jgi:hypothetical protein